MGATWGWVIRSLATSDDSLAIETPREQIVVTILVRSQKRVSQPAHLVLRVSRKVEKQISKIMNMFEGQITHKA